MTTPVHLHQSYDFIVKTAAGVPIKTFDRSEAALAFARKNREIYPGLFVDTDHTTRTTRRLWTDRVGERRAA